MKIATKNIKLPIDLSLKINNIIRIKCITKLHRRHLSL